MKLFFSQKNIVESKKNSIPGYVRFLELCLTLVPLLLWILFSKH